MEDLLEINTLYIRSVTEYSSVAFHSSFNGEQSQTLERIQRTRLRIILGDMYISYDWKCVVYRLFTPDVKKIV